MHSPESTQALAHLREASGPSPLRTTSSTPAIAALGSASATPAAPVIGQASKHLPHLVQASSMVSTRAVRAVSKASGIALLPGTRLPETRRTAQSRGDRPRLQSRTPNRWAAPHGLFRQGPTVTSARSQSDGTPKKRL